jgi:O-antigen/teichoic acid export membrane protein
MRVVSLRDRIASTRPLWADFVIAALVFWVVLLPFEYGGTSAVILATVVAAGVLTLLLARRWRRRM